MEDIPSSQSSFPDLELSQETMNQVLGAVGMMPGTGDLFSSCYTHEEDTSEEPLVESSSISVRRAVFSHTEGQLPGLLSPETGSVSPLAGGLATDPVHSPSYHLGSEAAFDTVSSLSSPQFSSGPPDCSPGPSENGHFRKCAIPINEPMMGNYGFKLELPAQGEGGTKHFLYSKICKRAYIKMGSPIQFSFTFTASPPEDAFLRVMAIHSSPENIADNLTCCVKHVDANKKKGLIFPEFFVRPYSGKQQQFCVHNSGRLSVNTPISSLQKVKSETSYRLISLFTFPCFTSDFLKTAQHVQLIFTLEQGTVVLGRCSLDVRICCSTSRDRDNDEKKRSSLETEKQLQRAPKRGATELTTCVLPAKRVCQTLSSKRKYTIETYPELFPYIDVCIKMMEKVHQLPHTVETGAYHAEPASVPQFESLEAWLGHLGLTRYSTVLAKNGISELCQMLSVTDEELKDWGIRNKHHRKLFLDGKDFIQVTEPKDSKNESTELFSSSQTFTSSQTSTSAGGIQRTQSFEVVEITVKKSLSSSSDSS